MRVLLKDALEQYDEFLEDQSAVEVHALDVKCMDEGYLHWLEMQEAKELEELYDSRLDDPYSCYDEPYDPYEDLFLAEDYFY